MMDSKAIATFVGEIARPFAIIVTSASAATATVVAAFKVDGFDGAAIFIAAVFAGVGALYGAKAWEEAKKSGQAADVKIAESEAKK